MESHTLRIYECLNDYRFPMIRLQGKWLLAAGFRKGDLVKVSVTEGELVIRPMNVAEMEAERQK